MGTRDFGVRLLVATIASLVFAGNAGAAITTSFDAGVTDTLTVTSDADDAIAVTCVGGNVEVNGVDPTGGPFACAAVVQISITGGSGANAIDLTGTPTSSFTSLAGVTVDGGDGDDTFQLTYLGVVPIDITGGLGNDAIAFNGSAGDDFVFLGTAPAPSVQIGNSDPTMIDATGIESATIALGGGNDVFSVATGSDIPAGTVTGGDGGDTFMIADGGWTVDGEGGSDFYNVTFGSLAGGVTIADTGSNPGEFDSLQYSDCSAIVDATTVTAGGETITFSGLEATPTCLSPPWPECGGGTTQQCWSDFTVGGGDPTGLGLELDVFQAAGLIQIQVRKAGGIYDVITGGPLTLTSLVGVTINLGSVDPGIFIATGDITSVTTTLDATNGNTISFVISPRASSWLSGGCSVGSCGDDTTSADFDYAGIIISAAGAPPAPPGLTDDELAEFNTFITASRGTWIATNAQSFSTPYWDFEADAFKFDLAAPHLMTDGATVNTGFFKAFVPDAFLSDVFGLDPSTVSTGTFVVEMTDGGVTTQIPFAVSDVASPSGILIRAGTGEVVDGVTLTPFEYSSPAFAVKKAAPPATPAPTAPAAPVAAPVAPDTQAPSAPAPPSVRFGRGSVLRLGWIAADDDTGVTAYEVWRDGVLVTTVSGLEASISPRLLNRGRPTVFTLVAVDAAGNRSAPSNPITVVSRVRPNAAPQRIPRWAWQLLVWRTTPAAERGRRPALPRRPVAAWYWPWASWRQLPYRVSG